MSELDPFTAKRVQEMTRTNHFDYQRVSKEMAGEFGRRVAYAVKEGLPREIAIESCREHFKIVGQTMVDIADECARIMKEGM